MHAVERRRRRSSVPSLALAFQLAACCEDGVVAMLIADGEGVPLAYAGEQLVCDQVAAQLVKKGRRIQDFHGTVLGEGQAWDVHMTRIDVDGTELILCVVGGGAEARQRQLRRSIESAQRIFAVKTAAAAG
jgi:hypothetical protein